MNGLNATTDGQNPIGVTLRLGRLVIVFGLGFLFIQLVADIVVSANHGCDGRACGAFASYSVGLATLMIGAVMLVIGIVASRPPQPRRDFPRCAPDAQHDQQPAQVVAPPPRMSPEDLEKRSASSSA
jgi:hypothetical protein